MKIITSGQSWIDIDVLACGIAYAELIGSNVKLILNGPLNATVPKTIKNLVKSSGINFSSEYQTDCRDRFILVDISDPKFFASFVDIDRVVEVWDHRRGFENYWYDKLGGHNIEIVGACATLIWEEFKKRGKTISKLSATLLYTAIFSNTLNLSSKNTVVRDKKALDELLFYANLPDNWIELYYQETEEVIFRDISYSIKNDTKLVDIGGCLVTISQLEFWKAENFLTVEGIEDLSKDLLGKSEYWFVTIPSISENKNYFITKSEKTKKLLREAMGVVFEGNIGSNNQIFLRKEIIDILRARKQMKCFV